MYSLPLEQGCDEMHEGHPGSSQMKSFARGYVWWPGIDGDLESVSISVYCVNQRNHKALKGPVKSWEWPKKPWTRLHIDHAGPVEGKTLLLIVGCTQQVDRRTYHSIDISNSNNQQTMYDLLDIHLS